MFKALPDVLSHGERMPLAGGGVDDEQMFHGRSSLLPIAPDRAERTQRELPARNQTKNHYILPACG